MSTRNELTDEMRADLGMHMNVMDGNTARLLFNISGVAALASAATFEVRVDEPMPDGVQEAISVIHDLAQSALKRAGCA